MIVPIPSPWALVALAVSGLALLVAFLNFRRKSSLKLRGFCSWTSSVDSEEVYASSIVIENQKDRAITIFSIHVRIGHNYFIEIEDFGDKPLILRAFETWHKEYGPIEFYSVSSRRIRMNQILADKRAARKIILSTGDGKYVIRRAPKRWSPIRDFFSNHMTAIVRPVRANYKDHAIGGRVSYVVDLTLNSGQSEVITVHKTDYQVQRFKSFRFTKGSLESVVALRDYLRQQVEAGTFSCKDFEVHDMEAWRTKERDFYQGFSINAQYISFVQYKVLGRIRTILATRRQERENIERQQAY